MSYVTKSAYFYLINKHLKYVFKVKSYNSQPKPSIIPTPCIIHTLIKLGNVMKSKILYR